MGYYNVIRPCVVGRLHYARSTVQPIELDDEVAASLVEDGSLERYGAVPVKTGGDFAEIAGRAAEDFTADADVKPRRTRKPRES